MEHFQELEQIAQRTPEWYQKRTEILTSTQIASVLHLNSYRSYDQLLKKQPDSTPSPVMKVTRRNAHQIDPITWGSVLESIAVQHLEQTTQKPVGELGLKVHDSIPYLGASPDGIQIVNSQPRLIEIKCPKKRQITYRVPLEYWIQVQIAMEVWNVDQALYCEYKFDVTTEQPTTTDLTVTYGQLARGVYWIYQDSWKYLIHRDREWFNRIKPQIDSFYQRKFSPAFSQVPSSTLRRSARKRKRSNELNSSHKKTKVSATSSEIRSSRFTIKERIPISRFVNYLQQDPILDWLDTHREEHDYEKEKSLFLDFYNQMNLNYKLTKINQIISVAHRKHVSYRVLNPSINNLLDIYQNNLLLKIPYDLNILEETQQAMEDQVGIIFMGQLAREIDQHFLWDTFDLLIHRDAFKKIFSQAFNELKESEEIKELTYIPIKLKYTTLEFRSGSHHLRAKHRLDQLKVGAITTALIMDRHGAVGVIPQHDKLDIFHDGLEWLKKVKETKLETLYPNMKNRYDSQWSAAKNEIAEDTEELTQICYLNVETRNQLHARGITKISQLKPENIEDVKNVSRILPHISEELYLPKLPNQNRSPIEIYLDFENCTSLGTNESVIFMMGILVKKQDQDPEYYPYLVKNLDKESEQAMLTDGLNFIRQLSQDQPTPIYHWSQAEPTLLRKAGFNLPPNAEWVDLYKHFLKNGATIPGCYTYGLKDVAKSLHKLRKIQSRWLHGLDGTAAMVMAWNIHHKCEITGDQFNQDPRIRKLCDYNYVDCQVLLEIRELLH